MRSTPPSLETRNCYDKALQANRFLFDTPVYHLPSGHACCPHCNAVFDFAAAEPTFLTPVPGNDTAIFFLCPKCHSAYQTAGNSGHELMADTCFANIKPTESPSTRNLWAITTMLVMELNDFDAVAAMKNGRGMTRELYLGICAGTHALVVLPGGVRIVAAKPAAPEAL